MKNERYDFFENLINSIDTDILEHGYLHGDSGWNFHNVSSPFNRLYFVTGGEGFVENSFHKVFLKPGNVYLIPTHSTYDYRCTGVIEKFYIHFHAELFAGRDMFEELKHCIEMPYAISDIFELQKKAKSRDAKDIIYCKSVIYIVICRLLQQVPLNYAHHIETSLKYRKVFEYIKHNLSAKLKVQAVADYINAAPSTISKNFKKDLGISLKNYLDKMLLHLAKERLLLTDMSIKEIAFLLSFGDEFYFSRFFKKHTGASPKEYRKLNKMN